MLNKAVFNPKGFTLVELLLTIAIFAFVTCILLVSAIYSIIFNESNGNLTIAITHAQYVMEEIKSTAFADIKSKIIDGYWDWDETEISSKELSPLINETIDTQVSGTDLLDVTTTLNWNDRGGRARETSLQTFFSKP